MTTAPFNPGGSGTSGLITSSTPSPLVGPVAVGKKRPNTRATFGTATQAQLISEYGNMSPDKRKALAAKLKAAGFRVPVTGAYNEKVRSAYIDANIALNDEIKLLQQNDPARLSQVAYNLDTYLQNIAGTGTGAGPSTYVQTTITNPTAAARTLDQIAVELLGRKLTEQERSKYTSMLQNEQKKASSATTTKVTPGSGGLTSSVTTGGLDQEQFLVEKLAKTDEAKAYKVLNAYEAVSKLFGGLNQ